MTCFEMQFCNDLPVLFKPRLDITLRGLFKIS